MNNQQIQDNIADSQPEIQAERQAEEVEQRRDSYREERADYMKDKYTPDLEEAIRAKKNYYGTSMVEEEMKTDLETCLRESKNFDEFCERCNTLLNKQDALAKDLWDEYQNKYGKQ